MSDDIDIVEEVRALRRELSIIARVAEGTGGEFWYPGYVDYGEPLPRFDAMYKDYGSIRDQDAEDDAEADARHDEAEARLLEHHENVSPLT